MYIGDLLFIKQPETDLLHLVEAMQRSPEEAAPKRLLGDYLAEHPVHSTHPMAEKLIEDLRNAGPVGSVITRAGGVHLIAPRTLNTHVVTRASPSGPLWRRSELTPGPVPGFWGDRRKNDSPPAWVETRLTYLPYGWTPSLLPLQRLSYQSGHDYIPAGVLRPGHPVGAHKDLRRKVKPTQLSRSSDSTLTALAQATARYPDEMAPRLSLADYLLEHHGHEPKIEERVERLRTPGRPVGGLLYDILKPEVKVHSVDLRNLRQRTRTVDRDYEIRRAVESALDTPNKIRYRMVHGGGVANAYSYPAFTHAAFTAAHYHPESNTVHVLFRGATLPAKGVTTGGVAAQANFRELGDARYGSVGKARAERRLREEMHEHFPDVAPPPPEERATQLSRSSGHPLLSEFTDPEGKVTLHHYAAPRGEPEALDLDPERFGESPWSKSEVKAERTPKVFFYLRPEDKEHFLGGRTHYKTRYDAGKIYDMMDDPKNIVSRMAARPPFNLSKTLGILRRLGYHGVFYSGGSFPTVALFKKTRVTKLARIETTPALEAIEHHIRNNDVHPADNFHHLYADALEDNGDPRAELVRHSVQAAQEHPRPAAQAIDAKYDQMLAELGRAKEMAGLPHLPLNPSTNSATIFIGDPAYPRPSERLLKDHLVIHPLKGPKGRAFVVEHHVSNHEWPSLPFPYSRLDQEPAISEEGEELSPEAHLRPNRAYTTAYPKAMSGPEFVRWLNQFDRDQKHTILRAFKQGGRQYRGGATHLKRSGYGYCPECKAPFIKLDKTTRRVTCPHGHTRILKKPGGPRKLAATRAPSGGAIVNNQFHTGGQFLPRAFKRISRVVAEHERAMRTRALKLARHSPAEDVLTTEDRGALKSPKTRGQYESLLGASLENKPSSILPTVEELKSLGEAGQSVKGQYGHLGRVLEKHLGRENARLFAAANAILSPQSAWEHHSRGAMRALRLWREAGSPTEPKKVAKIIKQIPTELYPMMDGQKARKLLGLFTDPEKYIAEVHHVSSRGRGKTVDFGRAHHDPSGIPIDTHQSKITLPTLRDGTKVSRKLAKAIAGGEDTDLHSALLSAQQRLVERPAAYNAYKVALAHAAHALGWEPREMQESVWASIVSLVAARNLGIPPEKILNHLKHESTFHAWNVGGLLSKPELLSDVKSLTGGREEAFAASANRPPSATGEVQVSNPAALEDAASRVPPNTRSRGAWHPVEEAMRTKLARMVPKQFNKIALLIPGATPNTFYRKGYTDGIPHAHLDRWLGSRSERRLSGNKTIRRDPNGDIHVFLHQTPVVTAHPNGDYRVRSGGWNTPTTRRTIHAVTGASVHSKAGVIYVNGIPLQEGMLATQLPQAPEVDYRPPELTPEDYYAG